MYRVSFLLIFIFTLLIFSQAPIAEDKEIVDPAELLPKRSEVGDFAMNAKNLHNFGETGIYNYMNGAGELYLEYGFERGVATEYEGEGKRVVVEIFKMSDGDAAYGIYTISNYASEIQKKEETRYDINEQKKESGKDLKGDNFNLIGDTAIEFYKGQFYGRVAIDKEDRFTLMTFANSIMSKIPKQLKRPSAFDKLPRLDLIAGSERYVVGLLGMNQILDLGRGDVWGFQSGVEAVAGEYRLTQGVYYSLAVVIYRQPQIADSKYKTFKNLFNNLDGYKPTMITTPGNENFIAVKTPDDTYMGMRLVSTRIEVYFNVPSPNHFRMILEKDPNISVKYPSK